MHYYSGEDVTFYYNDGFTGEIKIQIYNKQPEKVGVNSYVFKIEAEEMLKFVAECFVKNNRISKIEEMNWEELLK